jgi:hypothetical protein
LEPWFRVVLEIELENGGDDDADEAAEKVPEDE